MQAFNKTTTLGLCSSFDWQRKSGMLPLQALKKGAVLKHEWLDEIVQTDTSDGPGWLVKLSDIFSYEEASEVLCKLCSEYWCLRSDRFLFAQCGIQSEGTLLTSLHHQWLLLTFQLSDGGCVDHGVWPCLLILSPGDSIWWCGSGQARSEEHTSELQSR